MLLFFGWWLIGFVSWLVFFHYFSTEVKLGEFLYIMVLSIAGLLIPIIMLCIILKERYKNLGTLSILDKVIWEKK